MADKKEDIVDDVANTTVSTEDVDIDSIFNISTGPESGTKPSIFSSSDDVDTSFLNEPVEEPEDVVEDPEDPTEDPTEDPEETREDPDDKPTEDDITIDEIVNSSEEPEDPENNTIELKAISSLIKDGALVPFEDDKPIEEYTQKDLKELITANIEEKIKEVNESVPVEFFESLPQELQDAAKYANAGGTNFKQLFKSLSQVEIVKELDVEKESHQKLIVKSYLTEQDYGSEEEIENEISNWEDLGQLEDKAKQFKPKLDVIKQKQVEAQVAHQERKRAEQVESAQKYIDSVVTTLKTGEIDGIKINAKMQQKLYSGLVDSNFNSIMGGKTTELGHLMEKYQFVEPEHDKIAEVLWLLSDPEGYKAEIRKSAKNKTVEDVARKLKTAASNKNSSSQNEDPAPPKRGIKKGISRPGKNIFTRNN